MASTQIAVSIAAGAVIAILVFLFFVFFLTHCLCPWRHPLLPWRKKEEKLPLVEAPASDEETVVVKEERVEQQVKVTPNTPPTEEKVVMREKHQAADEAANKTNIVSTIAATIDERKSTSSDLSYESVQKRQTTLSPIAELNLLSQEQDRATEEFMKAKPTTNMSVVNVQIENDDHGSVLSGASLVKDIVKSYDSHPRPHGPQEYDRSSIISTSSRVAAMVHAMNSLTDASKAGSTLSRHNSDVSSVYSKPDLTRKIKEQSLSDTHDSLALQSLKSGKGSDSDSYLQPEVPTKADDLQEDLKDDLKEDLKDDL